MTHDNCGDVCKDFETVTLAYLDQRLAIADALLIVRPVVVLLLLAAVLLLLAFLLVQADAELPPCLVLLVGALATPSFREIALILRRLATGCLCWGQRSAILEPVPESEDQ